jgi:hypothetical protein
MPLANGMVSLYLNGTLFQNAYKVLSLSMLPPKMKGTVIQILNLTIWTQNKAFKAVIAEGALCLRFEEIETMEHPLYGCKNYSAKVWQLAE